MVLYFIVSALILEVITFYYLDLGFMPEYFGFNFAIICAIALLVFTIPNYTVQYIIYSIILLIQIVLLYVNYSLLVIYGDLFSMDMLMLGGEAMAAITSDFIYFAVIGQLIAVFLGILILGYLLLKQCRKEKMNIRYHFSVYNVVIIFAVQLFSLGYYIDLRAKINEVSVSSNTEYVKSDAFLMNTAYLKENSYAKYGTYGYFTNLIFNTMSDHDKGFERATIEYFDNGQMYDGQYYNQYTGNMENNGMFGKGEGQNLIVIMMESLEWFTFGDGTYDYELENFSDELTPNIYGLINSDSSMLATNFYAKSKTNYSEAFSIVGMYPVGSSLVDALGSGYDNSTNAFGYSLPSTLRDEGYTTNYLHSNELGFYRREDTHKYLGFDNVAGKDTLTDDNGDKIYSEYDLKWNHWDAEEDLVNNAMEYIVPSNYKEKPFYSYFLNVSSHGPYKYDKDDGDCVRYIHLVMYGEDDCYWDEDSKIWKLKDTTNCTYVKEHGYYKKGSNSSLTYTEWYANILDKFGESDPELCNEMIFYQCGVVGLDRAIEAIIDQMKAYKYDDGSSVYDNTTLILYSDHYCYYDGLTNRFKGFSKKDVTSVELNTIPMIIHSSAIKEYVNEKYPIRQHVYLENDRFTSAYDIIPTALDILGVKFNENLYLGHSLFRPADNVYEVDGMKKDMTVYYSNTGGIYSEYMYTYNLRKMYTTSDKLGDDTEKIFIEEVSKVLVKLNYLGILNKYHLYNKLTNV